MRDEPPWPKSCQWTHMWDSHTSAFPGPHHLPNGIKECDQAVDKTEFYKNLRRDGRDTGQNLPSKQHEVSTALNPTLRLTDMFQGKFNLKTKPSPHFHCQAPHSNLPSPRLTAPKGHGARPSFHGSEMGVFTPVHPQVVGKTKSPRLCASHSEDPGSWLLGSDI